MKQPTAAVATLLATAALPAACTSPGGPATLHGQAAPTGPALTTALPAGQGAAVHLTEGRSRPDRDAVSEDGHDRADHEQVRQGD